MNTENQSSKATSRRRQQLLLATLIALGANMTTLHAQVGIGTTSPNANAALDVTSPGSNKGFLPPRVALTSRSAASPLSTFVPGMIVYNTTAAGTAPNKVRPGLYYCDGTRWVRLIISRGDQTVDVSGLAAGLSSPNPFTGATFSPNAPANTDKIYINTTDGTTWTYDPVTKYESFEDDPSTPFYMAGSTTVDAGTNKTGSIYRPGNIGIGAISPAYKLHINDSVTGAGATSLYISNAVGGPAALRLTTAGNGSVLGQNGDTANGALLPNAGYWGAPNGGHDFQVITKSLGTTPANAALTIKNTTNYVGFNNTAPHALIQTDNSLANRKIVLYEDANNDHQFYGFGMASSTLRYQVPNPGNHVFYVSAGTTSSTELFRITAAGKVGINNVGNPYNNLEVNGAMAVGTSYVGNVFGPANGAIIQGNVGIGTNAPTQALQVQVSKTGINFPVFLRNKRPEENTGNAVGIGFVNENAGDWVKAGIVHERKGAYGVGDLQFLTTNVSDNTSVTLADARMTITADGSVGIGNTSPTAPLEFTAANNSRKVVLAQVTDGSLHDYFGFGTNSPQALRYQVGVNGHHVFYRASSTTGSARLVTIDDLGIVPGTDNIYALGTSGQRWNAVYATNGVITTSDRNLKTNIRNSSYGLKEIMQLRPVTYNWKSDPEHHPMVGLIAQEVETVIPEAVLAPAKEGAYYGMKYNELTPVLIKGMQEQQAQISALQQQIADKDQRIAALEAKEAAYAQLAAQVREMRQMLGMKKKSTGSATAKK